MAVDNPIPATGNGVLNNVVTGGQAGGNCPGAASCSVSNSTGGYTIVKTSSVANGAPVAAGSTLTYTLAITNTTSVALPTVTVTDDLTDVLDDATFGTGSAGVTPVGNTLTWTGPLPVSATPVLVTYTVIVNTTVTGNGTLTNAVVGVTPGSDCPGAATCITSNPVQAFTVVKSDSAGSSGGVALGQLLTYTLTIANTGTVDYPSASVTDDATDVLDDATFVSGSAGVTRSGNTITWTGPLPETQQREQPDRRDVCRGGREPDPGGRQRHSDQHDHRRIAGQ